MNTNQLEAEADNLIDKIDKTTSDSLESAREAAEKIRAKSEVVIDDTRVKVRENPVSCVIGAVVFGFALGCLIMAGRRTQTPQQRFMDRSLDQANDLVSNVSDRLSRAASNLKIW